MPPSNKTKRPTLAREGIAGRFRYFVDRAVKNIRQNLLVNLLTICTICLAFLILSLCLLVYVNLERTADTWSDKVQVTAYFDRELLPSEVKSISAHIRTIPGTDSVRYISREEALQRFQQRLKGQESLLEGVTYEILPSSLEIALEKDSRNSASMTQYVARLKQISEIGEVQYGEEWVQRFSSFMNLVRFAGVLLGGFIVFAVVFIVANTIKLTIYSRQDELELMGLVGATRMFIKIPFLIEGMLQGAVGAIIALLILSGVYGVFLHNADMLSAFNSRDAGLLFLPVSHILSLVFGGIALGFLGSLASLKRFISL